MAKTLSAGVLLFRQRNVSLEVFLVHPGGPFWSKKDLGAWSLPKGEYTEPEDPLLAARREFEEETGVDVDGAFLPLGTIKQKSGKLITAWAVKGDCDETALRSNTFTMEWPPKSGRHADFPEVDRAGWFVLSEARAKLNSGQVGFLDELSRSLGIVSERELESAAIDAKADRRADNQGSLF